MDLWKARNDAITYLSAERATQVSLLLEIFGAIDTCIDGYAAKSENDTYARVCGLTLLKAKNFAVGAYSLILDGLAQEAGALIRPFIEYTELLTYFRMSPEMVDRALSNYLPSAGARAKAIEGAYQDFREYLNLHASHSSYSKFSLSHLVEPGTLKLKKLQTTVPAVLDRNLRDFAIQLYLLLREALLSLEPVNAPTFYALAGGGDSLRVRLIDEFALGVP